MKAIIFDMYGVILKDPEGGLLPYINRFFPDLQYDDVYLHWNKANVGELSSSGFFLNLGFKGDFDKTKKEYLDTLEIDEAFYSAAETLKKHYQLALLSNDLSEWSNYLRDKFDINKYFDAVVISSDAKLHKPDTQIFALLLNRLSLPARDCVYIDDRRKNLAAAESLGMEPILFNSRNVEYNGRTVNNFNQLVDMLVACNNKDLTTNHTNHHEQIKSSRL
jgi:putative hydrolase of the HAD superfamily